MSRKTIRMNRTVTLKDGARWVQGLKYVTSDQELRDRGVPSDAYTTFGAADASAPAAESTDAGDKGKKAK